MILKKHLIICLLIWGTVNAVSGQVKQPDLTLPATPGWQNEHFSLPPEFASDLPFQGTEDILFAKGWADQSSDHYWTYCFLWHLTGTPDLRRATLSSALNRYFYGLVKNNLGDKFKDTYENSFGVDLSDNPKKDHTYTGMVRMIDYMSEKPITLNLRVYINKHKSSTNAFFEFSKQPFTGKAWTELEAIHTRTIGL